MSAVPDLPRTAPLPLQRDETYYRLRGIAEDYLYEEAELLDAGTMGRGWRGFPTTSPTSCQ